MIPEIVNALLARVRTGVRMDGLGVQAGHGVADPLYRPPRLPYAAVVGPIDLVDEPERASVRNVFLWARRPGHLLGAERGDADVVPAPGALELRLDGDTQGSVPLDFGTFVGQSLTEPDLGPRVAAITQQAVHAAVNAGAFSARGAPVSDPARLAELRAITVRWQSQLARLVLASGRRGSLSDPQAAVALPSRVAIGGDPALVQSLGLGEGSLAVEGRIFRHRLPSPSAMALDLRLDLWAGSQGELAQLAEAWTRIAPTRGQLLTQTGLLATDLPAGAAALRLLHSGEPRGRWTLALIEPGGDFSERLAGGIPAVSGAAAITGPGLRISGAGEADFPINEAPPVPHAWQPDHPAPQGYTLTLGLTVDPGAWAGARFSPVRLRHGARTALRLDVAFIEVDGEILAEVSASGERADGTPLGRAAGRVPAALLEAGTSVHVTADARLGVLGLALDGATLAPVPGALPAAAPGTPPGGRDMRLLLGDAGADPALLHPYRIGHLHLHGRPLGPPDPRARTALSPAAAWRLGDPVALARSEDGVTTVGEPFRAVVTGIADDLLTLDRPARNAWPRGTTLVYRDSLFFSQRQLKRRDDFMNRLYRLSLEYRVSAALDDRFPGLSAPLAETADVQTREFDHLLAEERDSGAPDYHLPPRAASPGITAAIALSTDTVQP